MTLALLYSQAWDIQPEGKLIESNWNGGACERRGCCRRACPKPKWRDAWAPTGRPPKLSAADWRRIEQGLKRGPQALGYETSLWTAWRVADLIERECGVKFSTVHAWRVLRTLGWTPQRPTHRALERDQAAIRRWKQQRWPEIKKKPKKKGEPSSSSTKAD